MSDSDASISLNRTELEQLYRSNVRQQTRADLGMGISTLLGASGLFYMLGPALVAYEGSDKSEAAREKLVEIMKAHGVRVRCRDGAVGMAEGTAEKLVMSFLTLGHDELLYLNENYELDPKVVEAHSAWLAKGGDGPVTDEDGNQIVDGEGCPTNDPGLLGNANGMYNGPVDDVKTAFGVENGSIENAEQAEGNAAAGLVAAGIECATNRVGHAGRKYKRYIRL